MTPLLLLHGYLLEGSGSNLWTRAIVRALCRAGQDVHLVCQEPHPEDYDFVASYVRWDEAAEPERVFDRDTGFDGRCTLHKPWIGRTLPVYVPDRYEEYERVVPMTELPTDVIEAYVERNVAVVRRVLRESGAVAAHANHAVLMPNVARRACAAEGAPFTIMPHGSALEYAVRPDERLREYAALAMRDAARVFTIGEEMRGRVTSILGDDVPGLADKLTDLNLGVDTSLFDVVARGERSAEVRALTDALAELSRGRTPAQRRAQRDHLHTLRDGAAEGGNGDEARDRTPDLAAFRAAIAPDVDYDLKSPDDGLEDRLAAIDWTHAPTVLFVGRLIANKGPQSVLMAAPAVLQRQPDARFLFVGHGPLREPLEAMVWAMEHGDIELLRAIAEWGTALEDADEPEPFEDVVAHLDRLEAVGRLDDWLESARRHVSDDSIVFTGYLTHTELRHVFACSDAAVFPSLIREAGPLVFLEALASGCHPLGTDFGGMAASIGVIEEALGEDVAARMRLSPERARLVADIEASLPDALAAAPDVAADLRRLAVERYDWRSVAETFATTLRSLPRA